MFDPDLFKRLFDPDKVNGIPPYAYAVVESVVGPIVQVEFSLGADRWLLTYDSDDPDKGPYIDRVYLGRGFMQ